MARAPEPTTVRNATAPDKFGTRVYRGPDAESQAYAQGQPVVHAQGQYEQDPLAVALVAALRSRNAPKTAQNQARARDFARSNGNSGSNGRGKPSIEDEIADEAATAGAPAEPAMQQQQDPSTWPLPLAAGAGAGLGMYFANKRRGAPSPIDAISDAIDGEVMPPDTPNAAGNAPEPARVAGPEARPAIGQVLDQGAQQYRSANPYAAQVDAANAPIDTDEIINAPQVGSNRVGPGGQIAPESTTGIDNPSPARPGVDAIAGSGGQVMGTLPDGTPVYAGENGAVHIPTPEGVKTIDGALLRTILRQAM